MFFDLFWLMMVNGFCWSVGAGSLNHWRWPRRSMLIHTPKKRSLPWPVRWGTPSSWIRWDGFSLASWQVAEDGWQRVPTKQARRAGMPRLPRPSGWPWMTDVTGGTILAIGTSDILYTININKPYTEYFPFYSEFIVSCLLASIYPFTLVHHHLHHPPCWGCSQGCQRRTWAARAARCSSPAGARERPAWCCVTWWISPGRRNGFTSGKFTAREGKPMTWGKLKKTIYKCWVDYAWFC